MAESNEIQLLSQLLRKVGWQDVDVGKSNSDVHLDCVFISEYALLGIVFSHSIQEVLGCWADSQAALMRIAEDDTMTSLKDNYLVFFISRYNCKWEFSRT